MVVDEERSGGYC